MHTEAPPCVLSTPHQSLLTGSTTVGCSGDYYPTAPQWGPGCQHTNPDGQIKPFPVAVSGYGSRCFSWALLFFPMLPFWIYAVVLFVRLDMEPEISDILGRCLTTDLYPAPVSVLQKMLMRTFFLWWFFVILLFQLLLEEVISSGALSQEVSTLVEMIWAEALGHLEHTLLKPVNSISLNDVSQACHWISTTKLLPGELVYTLVLTVTTGWFTLKSIPHCSFLILWRKGASREPDAPVTLVLSGGQYRLKCWCQRCCCQKTEW